MITTDIVDAGTPFAEDVVSAMAELGIRHYRWGDFRYTTTASIPAQLTDLKPRVAKLAALNSRHAVGAMYHTHSGTGGLVFYSDPAGSFVAAEATNGKPLWHFATNIMMKASPMTFLVDGRQYVAVAAGSNVLCFGLVNEK